MHHNIEIDGLTASWEHIVQFYRVDQLLPIRLAPKLTDRHIDVTNVQKMCVCLAAQVLSHSVAPDIQITVMTKQLPADAAVTAAFVEKMDTLFDMLNSRRMQGDRPSRWALSERNKNLNNLLELKNGSRNGTFWVPLLGLLSNVTGVCKQVLVA